MALPLNNKVDKSLQYRWGVVGIVLVLGFIFWYATTTGRDGLVGQSEDTRNLVNIPCPRCNNDPVKRENCSLCNGRGFIWIDKTKEIPQDVKIP
jgi:hypothetical protein